MLDFKDVTIEDKKWVDEILQYNDSMNCECDFGNIFIWKDLNSTKIAKYLDFLIIRWGKNDEIMYSVPFGKGNLVDAINQIINDAKENKRVPVIYGVTENIKDILENSFQGQFEYIEDDGINDYIYSVEKMTNLTGKKYHSKRNHISYFKKTYKNYSIEKITNENINDCIDYHNEWIAQRSNSGDVEDYSFEYQAVLNAFYNYDKLDFVGALLKVDNKVIAYTMGERISDKCFVTHFEKANNEIRGAYPFINQEFTRLFLQSYEYVNREEDLNVEGLRKAKSSYLPEIWLKKMKAKYVN